MSLLDAFEPDRRPTGQPTEQGALMRTVPFQPPGTPPGAIYMGPELGFVPYAGGKPRAGDLVAIVGAPGGYVAIVRQAPPLRDPIFLGACKCRCPAAATSGGMIAYLCKVQNTSILLIVDGASETVLAYSTLPEVFSGAGVAIDPEPPHDLYVLDDRNSASSLNADQIEPQTPEKQWFFLLKYTLSGNDYGFSVAELVPGGFTDTIDSGTGNTLSVIDGECLVTISEPPAKFLKWNGSGFTTVSLTQEGAPFNAGLVGNIVRVSDRPVTTSQFYCLSLDASENWQLLRFTPAGEIVATLDLDPTTMNRQLLTVCNRLYVFESPGAFRGSPTEEEEEEEEEGGGGGNGGGEEA